jgi:uncharacterized Zn finger protein
MTLQSFEQSLSEIQLTKGWEYYENGYISDLEERGTGMWYATVSGSEDYTVTVWLKNDHIKECSCDCPHDVDYCKHIIAVLYALNEKTNDLPGKNVAKRTKSAKGPAKNAGIIISDMVNSIPEKELRSFIIEQAKTHREFKNMLVAYFSTSLSNGNSHLYAEVIKNAATIAGDRHGFIDYYNANKVVQPIYQLLQKAKEAFQEGHFSVTADVAFAVIGGVHDMMVNMDDSSGSAGDCIREGFILLTKLCKTDIPYDLKERIFRDAEIEAKNKKYDYAGFDDYWLDILVYAAYDQQKEMHLLQLIDTMLSGNKYESSTEFDTKRLLKHKMILLRRMGDNAAANALRLHNLHFPEFRMELIEEVLQEKDYAFARKLISEGIDIASQKKHPGTIESYKKILLRISWELKDILSVRTVAEELYAGRNMDYYRVIKKTYVANEWPEVAEEFIKELQNTDRTFAGYRGSINAEALASIYIEEAYWERLLDLLQKNPRLEFVENHSQLLADKYSEELLVVYKETLINYAAQNTGRNHYVIIRKVLKKMQDLKGGKDMVKQLIDHFIFQYKARKAMIEELEKLRK